MKKFNFSKCVAVIILMTAVIFTNSAFAQKTKTVATEAKPLTYEEVPYNKLCSAAFAADYDKKGIICKIMFIGEFTQVLYYQNFGVNTEDRVFINHRDLSYKSAETALGSSDLVIPCFGLSIEKSKSNFVYEAKKGDVFEIKGIAEKKDLSGQTLLHISIKEINKVN